MATPKFIPVGYFKYFIIKHLGNNSCCLYRRSALKKGWLAGGRRQKKIEVTLHE
jgi:hypothetical protein